jgi:hypothetical protein
MHIPTPIYERVPQFWLLLGLLFMTTGTYLGFDYSLSFLYFGVGFVCCLWSLWIYSTRLRHRQPPQQIEAEQSEQPQSSEIDQGVEPAA